MAPFLTKQTQKAIVLCAIDWSLIGLKQFLYAVHQHSEKRIDIHFKVTFGFKYILKHVWLCIFFNLYYLIVSFINNLVQYYWKACEHNDCLMYARYKPDRLYNQSQSAVQNHSYGTAEREVTVLSCLLNTWCEHRDIQS